MHRCPVYFIQTNKRFQRQDNGYRQVVSQSTQKIYVPDAQNNIVRKAMGRTPLYY